MYILKHTKTGEIVEAANVAELIGKVEIPSDIWTRYGYARYSPSRKVSELVEGGFYAPAAGPDWFMSLAPAFGIESDGSAWASEEDIEEISGAPEVTSATPVAQAEMPKAATADSFFEAKAADSLMSPAIPDTYAYASRVPPGDTSGWQMGYPLGTPEQIDAIWAGEPYRLTDFDMERLADAFELYDDTFNGAENDKLVAAMLSRGYATQNPAYEAEIAENGKLIAERVARYGSGHYTIGVGLLARRWKLTDSGRAFVRSFYSQWMR